MVEGLPWYRLSNLDGERLVDVLVHLVNKEKHGYVDLQMQLLLPVGNAVETFRVAAAEIDRNDITVIFHALRDEGLLPRQIVYLAVYLSGVQTCQEHEHVVVALETGLDHPWKVAALLAGLVDAY